MQELPRGPWTVETVLTHVKELLESYDKRYEERFQAGQKALELGLASVERAGVTAQTSADRAVLKAELASEKRFESVNEFRGQLADQQLTFMPRTEVDVRMAAVLERLSTNADRIIDLQNRLDTLQAERAGVRGGYGYAVGVAGFVFTLVTLITMLVRYVRP